MYPIWPILVLAVICASLDIVSYVGNSSYGTSLPFFASSIDFSIMTLFMLRKQSKEDATTHIWGIFISGILDFMGSALLCWSLEFTSISSTSLFLNLQIQVGMVCSSIFLKARYDWIQILSSLLCVIFASLFAGLDFEGSNFLGDSMVLMAAVVLGMSSTLMEGLNN